jgi:predicted O-linked N-acetylglucosamine transferase (SPINDLY family)
MTQGASLHAAGQPERALVAFEKALALQPGNTDAASACATMLAVMGQPKAAYQILCTVREQLLKYADGAANLAIAAEDCGHADDARAAYARALELDPHHRRALNNTALACTRVGDWEGAIDRLTQCRDQAPDDLAAWLNLADVTTSARRFEAATTLLQEAGSRFPRSDQIGIRHTMVLAFSGRIEDAQRALDAMDTSTRQALVALLAQAGAASGRMVRKSPRAPLPDAYEMFCQQAFDAMQICDWRDHDRLTAVIREALARSVRTGQGQDGRDTQFYGLMLPLAEDELAQLRTISINTIARRLTATMAPFIATRSSRRDSRIHVGLALQSVADPRIANAILNQLQGHDRTRFAFHVYSPTPRPDPAFAARLEVLGIPTVEIAHMTDDEAVARMRLDELDVFVDTAFDTPWCRPEIPERRVAPVQIRQTTWHRHHPARPCEYNISDMFVHPPNIVMEKYGAVVRLPHSCWLATNNDAPDTTAPERKDVGLPGDALVLCTLIAPLMVDPESFSLWMGLLRDLPRAVWWLPAYGQAARNNLCTAARDAGVDPARIVFMQPCTRAQMLARVGLADLFVDTLRFNANHGLVDALRMGVPAVSCAGENMASRLGGSIVRAAGLVDCVADSPAAYAQLVRRLAQDPGALPALRQQLARARDSAPLFDMAARLREWEWAWAHMVQSHQDGLAPAAFDVPDLSVLQPAAVPVRA